MGKRCARCLNLCLNGRCSLHGELKDACKDFEFRPFALLEHLCSHCEDLVTCEIGKLIDEGEVDHRLQSQLKDFGLPLPRFEVRVVVPFCEKFKPSER